MYKYFKAAPFNKVQMFTATEEANWNINVGAVYVQNARPDGPAAWWMAEVGGAHGWGRLRAPCCGCEEGARGRGAAACRVLLQQEVWSVYTPRSQPPSHPDSQPPSHPATQEPATQPPHTNPAYVQLG
jgi:hypothetical protein